MAQPVQHWPARAVNACCIATYSSGRCLILKQRCSRRTFRGMRATVVNSCRAAAAAAAVPAMAMRQRLPLVPQPEILAESRVYLHDPQLTHLGDGDASALAAALVVCSRRSRVVASDEWTAAWLAASRRAVDYLHSLVSGQRTQAQQQLQQPPQQQQQQPPQQQQQQQQQQPQQQQAVNVYAQLVRLIAALGAAQLVPPRTWQVSWERAVAAALLHASPHTLTAAGYAQLLQQQLAATRTLRLKAAEPAFTLACEDALSSALLVAPDAAVLLHLLQACAAAWERPSQRVLQHAASALTALARPVSVS